jgi:thioredoxin reductase
MTWDAIVVGGGSAGLAAGLTLARAVRRTLVIDAGSPRNEAAPHSHGVIGFDGLAPSRMLQIGVEEVRRFGGEIRRDEVVSAGRAGDEFVLETAHGDSLLTRQLIVATGVRDHLPDVAGMESLWGTRVVICPYCDGWEWRGSRIGILGTGAKSVFQTHLLRQWSDRVTLFTNGMVEPVATDREELGARAIDVVEAPVSEVARSEDGALVVRTEQGSHEVDVIFTAPRAVPNDGILRALGAATVDTPGGSFVSVDARGATSVDGLWAAGNVVDSSLKVQTAAGYGMATATHVNERLVRLDVDDALAALHSR